MREAEGKAGDAGGEGRTELIRELGEHGVEWLREGGPESDVVMSSRVRLARNLRGLPFAGRASPEQRSESMDRVRASLMVSGLTASVTDSPSGGRLAGQGMAWVNVHDTDSRTRDLLVERQLISRQLANGREKRAEIKPGSIDPRAVAFDPHGERTSIMINEEDHLRIQALRAGLDLSDALADADTVDDKIEGALDYAYSPRFGYLTACPTNVGTGIRVSVMLHLPGLRMLGEIDKVKRAASDMSLAVRGFWGEGSDTDGDFFQVSNQTTLGKSERVVLMEFEQEIVPKFISYERRAREKLAAQRMSGVSDTIHRALGTLTHARRLGIVESMDLLSKLRFGIIQGWLETDHPPTLHAVHRLMLLIHPAHLDLHAAALTGEASGPVPQLAPEQRKPARAELCRRLLTEQNEP